MLTSYLQQMAEYGVRRVLVLSGEQQWCYQQAEFVSQLSQGDWLWLSDNQPRHNKAVPISQARSLMGQEYKHAVFDATQGFHAESLAILGGTLQAGSLLCLLLPTWDKWLQQPDQDSLRWSDTPTAIPTPHFVAHIQHQLASDPDVLFWQQGQPLNGGLLSTRSKWRPANGQPTKQQASVLTTLTSAATGIYVLIAQRGRGKSSVAGMLANRWSGSGECWLTAPAKSAVQQIKQWSDKPLHFIAPDNLLAQCQQNKPTNVDWLIIDEAAAIPAPILYQMIHSFSRVLLTTTVEGYEGTGRGFLLKFCSQLSNWTELTLDEPIRWAISDPLENLLNKLLLLDAEQDCQSTALQGEQIVHYSQQQLVGDLPLLRQYYGLLTSAHYRTSPLDLRRLLDAPKMNFMLTLDEQRHVVAGLWGVMEGGLSTELVQQVWLGQRRPRGNLVAQSLVAHAGQHQAALLRSVRISRIAVNAGRRRQGVAKRLIDSQIKQAGLAGVDYISVSFGYTESLWHFWQHCGFHLVHIGSQKEASSGCYSAMAIFPLSSLADQLVAACEIRLQRDWPWLKMIIDLPLIINESKQQQLSQQDWLEVAGFAYASRPPEAARAALCRLLLISSYSTHTSALYAYLQQSHSLNDIIQQLKLTGRKALIQCLRQEAAQLIQAQDSIKSTALKASIGGC